MKECNLPLRQQRQFLELVESGSTNGSEKQRATTSTLSLEQQGGAVAVPKTTVKRVSLDRPKPGIRLLSSILNSDSFVIPPFKPETPSESKNLFHPVI